MKNLIQFVLLLWCGQVLGQRLMHAVDTLADLVKIKPSSTQPDMLVLQAGTNQFRVYKWQSASFTPTNANEVIAYPYAASTGRWIWYPGCGCAWLEPCFATMYVTNNNSRAIGAVPWSASFTFSKFNPALGILRGVSFEVYGATTTTLRVESLDTEPRTVTVGATYQTTLSFFGSTMSADGFREQIGECTAYDGSTDFGGPGGGPGSGFSTAALGGYTVTNTAFIGPWSSSFASFTGSGTFTLTRTGAGTNYVTGTPSFVVSNSRSMGQTVRMIYSYCAFIATVGTTVWQDDNVNGLIDTGEVGLSGISVELYNSGGTLVDTATTDANGQYRFTRVLGPGVCDLFTVKITIPGTHTQTYDVDDGLTLTPSTPGSGSTVLCTGSYNTDANFGLKLI